MQHSKINTCELVDVYSFGHLLYELTFGFPLQESIVRQPIECSSEGLRKYLMMSYNRIQNKASKFELTKLMFRIS